MLNASSHGTHVGLLYPKRLRLSSVHPARGPSPVSAFDQSEVEATPEPAPVPKRKTIIIKRSSKASQQWRAPRAKASNQDSETLLKAVRETLEWYFRPSWPRDKEAVLRHIHISRGFSVPFDLVLNLRRLKQIIKKSTVEEEREVIEKALRKSEMLEVSKDGQLIHNKDIKTQHNVAMMIVVAGALLNDKGQVLVSQRKPSQSFPGKWEFPGGKVNPYEDPESALIRELNEELSIEIEAQDLKPLTFASQRHGDCHILMPLYVCTRWKGQVMGNEGQEVEWCSIADLKQREMPPGDIPLIAAVERAMHEHAQSAISIAA
ncbi:g2416 [Coccomyxa viridis]|uniref:8-oxo-dGTP diphosphatase n=1 Tax=Coccomyxa viridis TaxID=1274662 RepID=A0ABP1FKC8_9CHLO